MNHLLQGLNFVLQLQVLTFEVTDRPLVRLFQVLQTGIRRRLLLCCELGFGFGLEQEFVVRGELGVFVNGGVGLENFRIEEVLPVGEALLFGERGFGFVGGVPFSAEGVSLLHRIILFMPLF